MFTSLQLASRLLAATLAIAGLLLPAVASAQYAPSPGQQPYPPPPYGQPSYAQPQDETIHGRIYSINATFNITVTDDNGYMDNVELHQGTIINPTGLTLAPGMEVTIVGYSAGSAFEANEIDTPYTYAGPAPVPVYFGPGWWYPGFGYGYGPSFVLDFGFFGGGYRFERHDFDRHTFWAPRRDDRFRGNNGFAPRTVPRYQPPRNDGNRTYSLPSHAYNIAPRNDGNRGYSAPAHTWNGNAGTNYSGNRGYSAPAHTWNGGNSNYNGGNNGYRGGNYNAGNNGYRGGNSNAGNNGNRSESRPANTRSTGANESRSTHTDNGNHGDNGNHHGH